MRNETIFSQSPIVNSVTECGARASRNAWQAVPGPQTLAPRTAPMADHPQPGQAAGTSRHSHKKQCFTKQAAILRKQPPSGPAKAVTAGSSAPATGHSPVAPARSRHRIPPSRTAHTDGIHPWPQAGWHSSALRSGADSCNPLPFTRTGKFRIRTVMQSSTFPAMPDFQHAAHGMPATDQHVVFSKPSRSHGEIGTEE